MISTFTTVSSMVAGASNNDVCILLGYYTRGDGGGGELYWDNASTEVADNGLVFQVSGVSTGRWKRICDGSINVKCFGAVGNGTADDTNAIQNASDKNKGLYFPPGNYKITDTIKIKMSDCSVIGNKAFLMPSGNFTAINFQGSRITYTGLNISYQNVSSVNENAVAIWFFKNGSTTSDQVNNSVISDFKITHAHTGIKSTSGTGAVWQTEIRNILMSINPGSSSTKAIGINLGDPITGADNTTLTIRKVSVQDFTARPIGSGIRGLRITGYTDIRIEGFSCDGVEATNEGDLIYLVANQISITGSYHEKIINTLSLVTADRAPIQIIGRANNSTISIQDLIFISGKFNCGGSGHTGSWICFRVNPQVTIGNIVNLNTTSQDGSKITSIDFSQYRGLLNSNGNLKFSDIAYYERNAGKAVLDSDLSLTNSVSAAPITLTHIYNLPINTYAYLFCIKGYYDTDSNISFFDIVNVDSSFNGTKTVVLISSNKTGYPYTNTYSVDNGYLSLTRSGGSTMTIISTIIDKLGRTS